MKDYSILLSGELSSPITNKPISCRWWVSSTVVVARSLNNEVYLTKAISILIFLKKRGALLVVHQEVNNNLDDLIQKYISIKA